MTSSRVTSENTDLHRTSKRNATSRAVLARRQRVELGTVEALAGRVAANDLENQSQDARSPDCVVEITTPQHTAHSAKPRSRSVTVKTRTHWVSETVLMLYGKCRELGIDVVGVLSMALARHAQGMKVRRAS